MLKIDRESMDNLGGTADKLHVNATNIALGERCFSYGVCDERTITMENVKVYGAI